MWDLSNLALAVAAIGGLLTVMIQFGFDMADHGSPSRPHEAVPEERSDRRLKKAA